MDIRPTQPKRRVATNNDSLRGRMRAPRRAVIYARPHAVGNDIHKPASRPLASTTIKKLPVQPAPLKAEVKPTQSDLKPEPPKPQPPITNKHPNLPRQSRSHVLKRQVVNADEPKKHLPKKRRRSLMPTALTIMAGVLFIAGIGVVFQSLKTNRAVKAQVEVLAAKTDDEGMTDGLPSEDNPPDVSSYQVAPDMPRFLSIEKLDVKARVLSLGVSAANVLKAPSNIFDVGWYDGSAKPGENGTVVMDGHVSGPTKRGVFYSLGSLKPGDKITVERGDGKVFTYDVTGSEVFDHDKVDMTKLLTSSVPGKPALNLITCSGRFNVRTNQFEQRTMVFAVQSDGL